jgi:hypothetical protein
MNNKLNIEEIQLLIPDYITGGLSETEKAQVEKVLKESPELNEFYIEMKETLHFVSSVKFPEPAPQYWNTLLPRIHDKIERRQSEGFSWDKIAAFWKVLVPVAAIVLIALVYFLVKPSNTQLTEEKKIEKITNDTSGNNDRIKEEKQVEKKNESEIVKENDNELKSDGTDRQNNTVKRNTVNYFDEIVKDEVNNNGNSQIKDNVKDEQLVLDDDIDETSIFASGETTGLDEETVNELKKLDDSEQRKLLEELINSNL